MLKKVVLVGLLVLFLSSTVWAATTLEPGQLFAGSVVVEPDWVKLDLQSESDTLHVYVQGDLASTVEFVGYDGSSTIGNGCQITPNQPIVPESVNWRTCTITNPHPHQFEIDNLRAYSVESQTVYMVVSDGTWAPPTFDHYVYIPIQF